MAILHVRSVPDDLYARLKARAEAERRSISGEVILLLERALAAPDGDGDPAHAWFARRQEMLKRQAEEWHRARTQPMSQQEYDRLLADIRANRVELRASDGGRLDSLDLLHAARAERERPL